MDSLIWHQTCKHLRDGEPTVFYRQINSPASTPLSHRSLPPLFVTDGQTHTQTDKLNSSNKSLDQDPKGANVFRKKINATKKKWNVDPFGVWNILEPVYLRAVFSHGTRKVIKQLIFSENIHFCQVLASFREVSLFYISVYRYQYTDRLWFMLAEKLCRRQHP